MFPQSLGMVASHRLHRGFCVWILREACHANGALGSVASGRTVGAHFEGHLREDP